VVEGELDTNPWREVGGWLRRHRTHLPEVGLHVLGADADLLPAIRTGVQGEIIIGSLQEAWDRDPINSELCDVIYEYRGRKASALGVCYGQQILGRVLDGRSLKDFVERIAL
jgi:GMP synthase-like glutamine amidotransferase